MAETRSQLDRFLAYLLSTLRAAPWWVGPPLAVFTWAIFQLVLPLILGSIAGADEGSGGLSPLRIAASLSVLIAPLMAGMFGVIWVLALVQKRNARRRLERQTGIDSIRALSWREFELLLAEAFRRQGYRVRETGTGADGGIDLILIKDGREILVQAKQWKAWKVGVKVVRELFGVQASRRASGSILVTSGYFTQEAREFGSQNAMVLIDGQSLAQLVSQVQQRKCAAVQAEPHSASSESGRTSAIPKCPKCGSPMVRRISKQGRHIGETFWGCPAFPACRGTRPMA